MAESPIITCPECTKKFKGKANLEGKRIKCPFCAEPFIVPNKAAIQDKAGKGAAAASAPPQVQGRKIFDDEEDANPYGITHLDIAPRCPNCAQKMASEDAYICLFCGYNTLTREVGKTQKSISHTGGEIFAHLLPAFIALLVILIFLITNAFYSLLLPGMVSESAPWLVHESLRFWLSIIVLAITWPLGYFAYKRIIVNTTPPEKIVE